MISAKYLGKTPQVPWPCSIHKSETEASDVIERKKCHASTFKAWIKTPLHTRVVQCRPCGISTGMDRNHLGPERSAFGIGLLQQEGVVKAVCQSLTRQMSLLEGLLLPYESQLASPTGHPWGLMDLHKAPRGSFPGGRPLPFLQLFSFH